MTQDWDKKQVNLLMDSWKEGLSASEVAQKIYYELGIWRSRGSVLGKIDRLGLLRKNQVNEM